MVDPKIIHKQLKDLKFGGSPWNQAELHELPKIIHDGEKISECVNGFYEGGVALLVATEMRLLLIDKKPLKFLTVEDFRFDMINEIDFSHRLLNATITISTGSKTLRFTSLNHGRLRHLISLVQEHMTNSKKEQAEKAENQQQHLQEINRQLQMYLMAQHQQLQQQLLARDKQDQAAPPEVPKPSPQLSDYLFAQRLLEKFQEEHGPLPQLDSQQQATAAPEPTAPPTPAPEPAQTVATRPVTNPVELVADARREVFSQAAQPAGTTTAAAPTDQARTEDNPASFFKGLEINPLRIAYSKLPMMLRNRRFAQPSFRPYHPQG